ncbi:hypothetical protein HY642_03810, partial [Candidatus Woesearchaeota archaeon]|nr:hypothetical protein [Candidatus Woesearchaeota archaeon]
MNFKALGTPKPGNYDPSLVDRLNKAAAEEARRAEAKGSTTKPKAYVQRRVPKLKVGIEYAHLLFEDGNQSRTYDLSLERVKAAGYERHMRLNEVFAMEIDSLEGRLDPLHQIYLNQMRRHHEWFSIAFERDNDYLITYIDPEGLYYDSLRNAYAKRPNFKCSEMTRWTMTVDGLKRPQCWSGEWLRLDQLGEVLGRYLIGRKYPKVPKELGGAQSRVHIMLPATGQIRPAFFDLSGYRIHAHGTIESGSRGVREAT